MVGIALTTKVIVKTIMEEEVDCLLIVNITYLEVRCLKKPNKIPQSSNKIPTHVGSHVTI